MTDHYYSDNPHAKSNPETWEANLKGNTFRFTSDTGVFSKGRVDYGSQVLIETVDLLDFPKGDFLDLGCGYGPIGLSLAKACPKRTIELVDVNERAVSLAKKNAEDNQISNVEIHTSYLYEELKSKEFAGIFSNPPIRAGKETVHAILEDSFQHLKKEGRLTIVIQKKQGAPSAKKKMQEVFGNVERLIQDKGYWILQSRKEE